MGILRRRKQEEVVRAEEPTLTIDGYLGLLEQFQYSGNSYSVPGPGMGYTQPGTRQEQIGHSFRSYAALAYKTNPIVFSCMNARSMLFSEARFQYRRFENGRPGDLFGDVSLAPLEAPWPGATTSDLLKRMIQYADLAGNAFVTARPGAPNELALLRPDWVTIVAGVPDDPEQDIWSPEAEVIGYVYNPGGYPNTKDEDLYFFNADEVAHFAPIPDPEARYRGMSWLTPLIKEIMADKAQTQHKLTFMENAATPNLIVKLDVPDLESFDKWVGKFRADHEGTRNAYKTLFLAAGADATPVGIDMKELDFSSLQAGGETRIAAAAGVPPILAGLQDGLKASTYSNYQQARRHFADHTMRPLWRDVSGSLANIVKVPVRANLWYDDRDISALQDDRKDGAVIQQTEAATISSYLQAGFTAESVVAAVQANDLNLLQHSGLFSVQLQKPGAPEPPKGSTNGNGSVPPVKKGSSGGEGA